MYCKRCGAYNEDGRDACKQCGASLIRNVPIHQERAIQPIASYHTQASHRMANESYQTNAAQRVTVDNLRTNRGLWKTILLSIITLGLYGVFVTNNVCSDLNKTAGRHDHKKMISYWWLYLPYIAISIILSIISANADTNNMAIGTALFIIILSLLPIALSVGMVIWEHKLCNRLGNELKYRHIDYKFSAADFWLWGILGCLIIVGPFIFTHKMLTASNKINEHHNCFGD